MKAQFAALEKQVAMLNEEMKQYVITSNATQVNPQKYAQMARAMETHSKVYRNAALSTGMFEAEQLKLNSATDEYVKALNKQKISFRQWYKDRKLAAAAYREQLAMQDMIVKKMPGTRNGRNVVDVVVPNEVHKDLNTLGNQIGWIREQTRSAATQMVNWGKNTQWAGRQLMVGFTMPVAAFGAAAGVMSFQVDKEMTRIQKVYDTTAQITTGSVEEQMAVEKELMGVREQSMRTATASAKAYGAAATDTLKVQADLAATGLKGTALQSSTAEVMRIATLGELDYQEATQATIALQTAFKLNTQELTEAFNFMNATENATSLSIQDIAEATPRAASAMSALGVNVKEMTVMLTSMKESGVDAAEAANALKSATGTILAPSPAADAFIKQISKGKVQVTELAEASDGNLYVALQKLSEQMNGLDKLQKQQILVKLFGKYQFNRVSAMLYNMEDAFNGVQNQTAKAMDLMGADTETLADTAERELSRFQNSVSGKFKTTLETLKVELAKMGEPFLEVATDFLRGITAIVDKFNDLPAPVKKAATYFALAGAAIGPLIMLTGLFANLLGNLMKFSVFMTGFLGKMEILDKSSRTAKLAAKLAGEEYINQGTAVQKLANEINILAQANEKATIATKQLMLAQQGYTPAQIALMTAKPKPPPGAAGGVIHPGTAAAKAALVTPDEPKSTKGRDIMGGGMIVSAAAMTTMAVSSNETVDHMAEMVMYAALLAPLLSGLPWAKMGGAFAGSAKSLKGGFIPAIKTGVSGALTMVKTFAKFAGPTGLIIGAIGGMVYLNKKIGETSTEMEKLTKTGEKWADILGYEARQPGTIVDPKTGEVVDTLTTRVNKLRESAPEVGNAIKDAMDKAGDGFTQAQAEAEAMNIAIRQGLEVLSSGGTAEQARQAVEASLMAGVQDATKVAELMAKVDLEVDFNLDKDVMRERISQVMDLIQQNINDEIEKNKFEMVADWVLGTEASKSNGSEQAVKDAANTFYDQWETANDAVKIRMIRAVQTRNEELRDAAIKPYFANEDAAAVLKKYDITTGGQMWEAIQDTKFTAADLKELEKAGISYQEISSKLFDITNASDQFTTSLAEQAGLQDAGIGNMEELLSKIIPGYKTVETATKDYNQQIELAEALMGKVTNKQKLQILNQLRVARGQEKTKNLLDMFGPATQAWAGRTAAVEGEVDDVNRKLATTKSLMGSITNEDITNLAKGAMGSFQQGIADATSADFDSSMNSAIDAAQAAGDKRIARLDRRQENADAAFDKRWENKTKAVEDHFDKRIEGIKKEMDAEQKADDLRQKLFDAEMARIDRLNEAANRNVDFNAALNAGNFDEAAKIRNDAEAAAANFALEQAGQAGTDKSQAKQEGLQKQMDALEKAKNKRLDHLKEVEDAQKRALDRQQQREADALKASVQANVDAEKKKWEVQKKHLDEALAHFLGYTATSDKDLREHIKLWEDRYSNFNLVTEGKFNLTTENIARYLKQNLSDSQREFANEKQWAENGYNIANAMLKGAFGMTTQDFKKWLITGVFPESATPPTLKDLQNMGTPGGFKPGVQEVRHAGGQVGTGGSSRKGYARTAPMSRNERMVLAERGEFIVNKHASNKHSDVLNDINSGNYTDPMDAPKRNTGGASMGFAGLMGALMAKAMFNTVATGIKTGATNALNSQTASQGNQWTSGTAGDYGNLSFDATQLDNASTIATVGQNMGMSARDIQIGIMTAITESMLRNVRYGDRDSQGLFQQRPSQGWGTIDQVTNPTYAASKFFSTLKGVENRVNMSPWEAAQAVQRSAYADGSNYQQYWDEAEAIFRGMKSGTNTSSTSGGAVIPGVGGKHKPVNGGYITQGIHDSYTGYPAIDIGVPVGTPVYAVGNGVIGISKDYVGSDGRVSNGGYYSYGRYMTLNLDGGGSVSMAHLSQRYAQAGQRVTGGSVIAKSGNTGHSFGPHLHFGANGGRSPYDFYPQLKVGGFTLSDGMARLHKGEMVATKPMTDDIKQGVKNFANGGTTEYNVNVHVTNPSASADEIVNKTLTALKRIESRKPQSRRA